MNEGRYEEAIEIYTDLGNYKDSTTQIKECKYLIANGYLEEGRYEEALELFNVLDYKDSKDKVMECKYRIATNLFGRAMYAEAFNEFKKISGYKDSSDMMEACNQKYIISKTTNVDVVLWNALNEPDPGTKAASSYITIESIMYTVSEDNDITFYFNVRASRAMTMSFFSPPSGNVFMYYKGLSSGTNKYSFTIPLKSIVKSDYYVTCKFYNGDFTITGYLGISELEKLIKLKDLYENNVFDLD